MAGDWLKMRTTLPEERAVLLIAELTSLDEFFVIGKLFAVWRWAGQHTATGKITGVTQKTIDRIARCENFSEAMKAANWLEIATDGAVMFPQWKKHNDKSERQRELSARRSKKYRDRKSRVMRDGERDGNHANHATRGEENREEENRGVKKKARAFVRPTLDEVKAYCESRKNSVDPEKWLAYYESNGWKVGRNSMKDWRAAVRNWEKNDYDSGRTGTGLARGGSPASCGSDLFSREQSRENKQLGTIASWAAKKAASEVSAAGLRAGDGAPDGDEAHRRIDGDSA